MEGKEFKIIPIRVAPKQNFILKEILSRVHEKKRSEFVREAIFYWDYILKHSNLGSRLITMDKNEKEVIDGLFPSEYFSLREYPDMSIKEKFKNIDIKPVRFEIGEDEIELQEICKRAVSLDDFIKEAIFEWDCLVNTSNIFLSRFIKLKENSSPKWHISGISNIDASSKNSKDNVSNSKYDLDKTEDKKLKENKNQSNAESIFRSIVNDSTQSTKNSFESNISIDTPESIQKNSIQSSSSPNSISKGNGMAVGRKNKLKF